MIVERAYIRIQTDPEFAKRRAQEYRDANH